MPRSSMRGGLAPALLLAGAGLVAAQEEATAPLESRGAESLRSARQAYDTARYDEALEMLGELRGTPRDGEARDPLAEASYARALRAVGRYEEAADELVAALTAGTDDRAGTLALELARSWAAIGRREEAEDRLRGLLDGPSGLEARLELGVLLIGRGELEAGREFLYSLIEAYNRRTLTRAPDLLAVGHACRLLGDQNPQLYKDALRAFDEAITADASFLVARVAVAELFLEKYNSTQAIDELRPVLTAAPTLPEARLALARVLNFDGVPQAMEQARKALETNPNLVAARTFIAQLELELERFDEAQAEARAALEVDPGSLEAMSVLAAASFLRGDEQGFSEVEQQVLAANPRYADFYNNLADACVRNRFYREAVDFATRAVEMDPTSWRGWGLLGLNQLRVARIEEGRRNLEAAFAGDPYNVWIKNTLDLVDSWSGFSSQSSARFEFIAHDSERALLAPYALDLAEEAYTELSDRYGIEPPTPIRLEFYRSDADFSVRTIGLAGMGALGVCFGEVVAQDSPRARRRGTFNWGSTLWHEIAHSFTLAASGHRVPRWLTEGLSVLEERRARRGWGDDAGPRFLTAWRDGELLPIATLNDGFVRPDSPERIGLSYLQASYACELIERDWGFDAILSLLHGYRDGKETVELLEEVLEEDLASFDERFDAYLRERFGSSRDALGENEEAPDPHEAGEQIAGLIAGEESEEVEGEAPAEPGSDEADDADENGEGDDEETRIVRMPGSGAAPTIEELKARADERPDHFPSQYAYGRSLYESGDRQAAFDFLERAKTLFPEFADDGSPYHLLAEMHEEVGELEEAVEELVGIVVRNENEYDARESLARLRTELGDETGAIEALEEILYIFPYESEVHAQLAELHSRNDDSEGLVRARRSLVALHPVDRAGALYDLATALRGAGRDDEAMDAVVGSLEIAPSYRPALELLLELHRSQLAPPGLRSLSRSPVEPGTAEPGADSPPVARDRRIGS